MKKASRFTAMALVLVLVLIPLAAPTYASTNNEMRLFGSIDVYNADTAAGNVSVEGIEINFYINGTLITTFTTNPNGGVNIDYTFSMQEAVQTIHYRIVRANGFQFSDAKVSIMDEVTIMSNVIAITYNIGLNPTDTEPMDNIPPPVPSPSPAPVVPVLIPSIEIYMVDINGQPVDGIIITLTNVLERYSAQMPQADLGGSSILDRAQPGFININLGDTGTFMFNRNIDIINTVSYLRGERVEDYKQVSPNDFDELETVWAIERTLRAGVAYSMADFPGWHVTPSIRIFEGQILSADKSNTLGDSISADDVTIWTFRPLEDWRTQQILANPNTNPLLTTIEAGAAQPQVTSTPSATNLNTASSWAREGITEAIGLGIVPSALQNNYRNNITRAEFTAIAVMVYETITGREITGRVTFNDTADINVQKAAYLGIITGTGNNNFSPNMQFNREQAAVIVSRLAEVIDQPFPASTPTFADNAEISSWARQQTGQAQAAGIMEGVGGNRFNPRGTFTREQSIITMLRLFDYLS